MRRVKGFREKKGVYDKDRGEKKINYLTEILGFYRWMEEYPLPPLLQAYWHLLMYCNNKAAVYAADKKWYWPVEFGVSNGLIIRYLGLKDRHHVKRVRQQLITAELIHYWPPGKAPAGTPGKTPAKAPCGKEMGKYALIPFDKGLEGMLITIEEGKLRPLVWSPKSPQDSPENAPYINVLNNKHTLLSYITPTYNTPIMPEPFHILPALSTDEKQRLEKDFPDKIERFWEEQRLRELKGEHDV